MTASNGFDNTNSGALFKNDKKETPKHPDYKGSINAGGVDYWVSAWINTAKSGSKYMSCKLQPKDEKPQTLAEKQANSAAVAAGADFDDGGDLPF